MRGTWVAAAGLSLVIFMATAAGRPLPAEARPRLADERVLLRTNLGDIVIALYPEVAPRHVEQVLKLVRLGVYDSIPFHRVDPQFLVQLSNAAGRRLALTAEQQAAIRKLPAEFSQLDHRPGTVSMAHEEGDPNSAETSFSLLLVRAPHLDGKYTIFGEVEWGNAVLSGLAAAPRDPQNRPRAEILVEGAFVKTAAEITAMRAAGELQLSVPAAILRVPDSVDLVMVVGLSLMVVLSLFGFLLSGRIQPHRVSAFSLLTILTGAFFLMRETFPGAQKSGLYATVLFFGLVALFKLMNRFEASRPPSAPARPAPGSAPATEPASKGAV